VRACEFKSAHVLVCVRACLCVHVEIDVFV